MIGRAHILTYFYLLIYILLSSDVILYNKWVLSPKYFNFPFPITLTMIHMAFSGIVAFFLIRVFKDWKLEKKLSNIFNPNSSNDTNEGNFNGSDLNDEEAPLIPSRLLHIGHQLT